MSSELLEIQPQELSFIFELKKQSTCSLQLVNKSNYHVAFKVKTTAPKKYGVRPMSGIIKPKSTCGFVVTMQAQLVNPPDIICKDMFLLQSTIVPVSTTDEDITSSTFAKNEGKYIEEKKLKVILVTPPLLPVLNGTSKQAPAYETLSVKDEVPSRVENLSSNYTVTEDLGESKMGNVEKVEPRKVIEVGFGMKKDEEQKLVKDVEEMKSKLNELELKLNEAESTICKLTEERRLTTQEKEIIRQELVQLSSKRSVKRVEVGFPLLFVCMLALVNAMLGYILHR